MPADRTHLDALELRLSHERSYLAAAKTDAERELRHAWIRQVEKEIAAEFKFLGVNAPSTTDAELLAMSDEELLAELGA